MKKYLRRAAAVLIAGTLILGSGGDQLRASGPTVGWSGDRLTLNGAPKFLLMVSYFDALDVPYDRLVRDFSTFRSWGIDGVRILPNWLTYVPSTYAGDTVIDEAGNLRPGPLANLESFISMAGDYGLIVDVTLTADTIGPAGQPSNPPQSSINYDNYKQGVGALISHLNAHGHFNVMYDLQNEHTRGGNGPQNINLSPGQLTDLVAHAKNFTDQPVFVSVEQSHSASYAGNEAFNAGENAVAYHEPRNPGWWGNTGAVVNDARNASGGKPVYLQEPGRIGDPGSCCSASDFRAAYDAAANAGAAAWTFHSQAGHYMNVDDFLDRLAPAETEFLSTVRSGGGSGGSTLTAGQQLNPGQSKASPNGLYTLTYQTDGNLVLYGPGGALWHTGTFGTCAGTAIMQGDGNFVVYDCGGTPLWHAGTSGNPGAYVSIQDDSNLVVYASNGSPLWWRWM